MSVASKALAAPLLVAGNYIHNIVAEAGVAVVSRAAASPARGVVRAAAMIIVALCGPHPAICASTRVGIRSPKS